MRVLRLTRVVIAGMFCCGSGSATPASPPAFSTEAERCIVPASLYHRVNYHVLRAILVVESGLNPNAVNRNNNNTVDVGIGQINSIHFRELSTYGISPTDLKDICIGTYVAAWKLKKHVSRYGNTWDSIARYHSASSFNNHRYQVLLKNELIRSGVLRGTIQPVPTPPKAATADRSDMENTSIVADQSSTLP